MTKSIVTRVLLAMGVMVLFAPWSAQAFCNGPTKVAGVQVQAEMILTGFTDCPATSCGGGQAKVAGANPTAIARAMYANLLAAVLSGKTVWVYTAGCDGLFEILQFVTIYP